MTDDTTTTAGTAAPARVTIDDVAKAAVTTPESLSHAEITRLGTWITDHEAHIASHNRLLANLGNRDIAAERRAGRAATLAADPSQAGLVDRIDHMKPAPTSQMLPLPPADPVATQTGNDSAAATQNEHQS